MQHRVVAVGRRLLQRLTALPAVARLTSQSLHHLDRVVYRLTGGRAMLSSTLSGLPVVLLTTVGSRSGRLRTLPVLALPVRGGLVVIASNWGAPHHPGWYHNLRRHPEATVAVGGRSRRVSAREAAGDERRRLWELSLQIYPGLSAYASRAVGRQVPVLVLEFVTGEDSKVAGDPPHPP